jgi:deoxyribodipyrimidine photo-lyase
LAINYAYFSENYDSFRGLPNWAKLTLNKHKKDHREYIYNIEQLENAETHDPYWNASQNQMRITGKMHGYMRMYWGKKILEWSKTPQEAFKAALYLNDKYELDGRDPNGFAGVAWCFGKHDRPWKERPVFGTVRFMNANGLKRKFKADQYVKQIKRL